MCRSTLLKVLSVGSGVLKAKDPSTGKVHEFPVGQKDGKMTVDGQAPGKMSGDFYDRTGYFVMSGNEVKRETIKAASEARDLAELVAA